MHVRHHTRYPPDEPAENGAICAPVPIVWLLIPKTRIVTFWASRHVRRNLHNLSSGVEPLPFFKDNTATIYVIANTGVMLDIGQERSKEETARISSRPTGRFLNAPRIVELIIARVTIRMQYSGKMLR